MHAAQLEGFLVHILTLACMKHIGVVQSPLFQCQQKAGFADTVDRKEEIE